MINMYTKTIKEILENPASFGVSMSGIISFNSMLFDCNIKHLTRFYKPFEIYVYYMKWYECA